MKRLISYSVMAAGVVVVLVSAASDPDWFWFVLVGLLMLIAGALGIAGY